MTTYSVVEWFGSDNSNGHHCGYCNSDRGSLTHGMWGHRLQTGHYAQLLNRGWRRSGKYLYHPIMDRTCCPQYAIRIDAKEFKPTKSQKKVIRKVNKFLLHGKQQQPHQQNQLHNPGGNAADDDVDGGGVGGKDDQAHQGDGGIPQPRQSPERLELPHSTNGKSTTSTDAESSHLNHNEPKSPVNNNTTESRAMQSSSKKLRRDETNSAAADDDNDLSQSSSTGIPSKPINIRHSHAAAAGVTASNTPPRFAGKSTLSSTSPAASCMLPLQKKNRMRTISSHDAAAAANGHAASCLPSTSAPAGDTLLSSKHAEKGEKTLLELLAVPDESSNNTKPPVHRLELRLMRSSPQSASFKATLEEEYAVYCKYEAAVHSRDRFELGARQFVRFLIDSPLMCDYHPRQSEQQHSRAAAAASSPPSFNRDEPILGSFHQQYVLDGRIIAVDVIDILPSCVTSVYFFYDPDYSFLSLGTYSVMREAALVQELSQVFSELKYISLGYYVHSCSKMQYKSRFHPSELLCPETYSWHPIEKCLPLLNTVQYRRFAAPSVRDDEGDGATATNVLVFFQRQPVPYMVYQSCLSQLGGDSAESLQQVRTYAKLVGRTLAGEMLLFRETPAPPPPQVVVRAAGKTEAAALLSSNRKS